MKNATLSEALQAIENLTGYRFSYSSNLFNNKKVVNFNYQKVPLKAVLYALFEDKVESLRLQGDNISIKIREPTVGKGSISGQIRSPNGGSVFGAAVALVGATAITTTGENGEYEFKNLETESYTVEVRSVGFLSQMKTVRVADGGKIRLDFILNEANEELSEVTVIGKTESREIKESGFNVDVIDIKRYANNTSDVNQVLRQVSGITIRETGGMGSDFTFRINGLDAKIFIDGVPMENFGSSMTLNNIPVDLVERVEIYKGVVPAHLGSDSMGGAVNIVTKRRSRQSLEISHSYGSFNTHRSAITGNLRNDRTGLVIRANGFYNYSDNNYLMYSNPTYNVSVEMAQNGKFVMVDKARRFYDKYWSAMGEAEAGFEKTKWADWFSLGLLYSANLRQNQLGATVNAVMGGNWSENRYVMPTVKYKKSNFIVKGLYANVFGSYSNNVNQIKDTATYRYDWSGSWVKPLSLFPRDQVNMKYRINNYNARLNFNYDLGSAQNHRLSLNYNFNSGARKSYDMLMDPSKRDVSGLPNKLDRHIAGLSWQGQWLSQKLISDLGVKYYGLNTSWTLDERKWDATGNKVTGSINTYGSMFHFYSAVASMRFRITEALSIKASIERGYNLPEMIALYGDGQNHLPNYKLKPEKSDNANLGGYFNRFFGNHFLVIDGSIYYRNSTDYIGTRVVEDNFYQSFNMLGVKLKGVNFETRYGFKKAIDIVINGSYETALDSRKYVDEQSGTISATYNNQIPNRPWLYGNAGIIWGKDDLIVKNSRLQLSYNYQYTHWYYLTWSNLGAKRTKSVIPSQHIHSLILGYSWKKELYNLSIEARNLTNNLVYDNFRLQKPGRAFYVKVRVAVF